MNADVAAPPTTPPSPARRAWITGAGKGIGRAVALKLAGRGWTVAASARTNADLESLSAEAEPLRGRITPYPLDVTDEEKARETADRIEAELGPLDLALLNAGSYERFGVHDFSVAKFRRQMDLNVMGTVHCLAPAMAAFLGRGGGHIAVVSSVAGYRGLPFASAYGASKAALINMCEALKPELDGTGVTLSLINPGFVRTPLTDKNDFPMPFLMEADEAAERIVTGLERGRFEIAFPTRFVMILKTLRLLPYWLYFRLTGRMT